MLDCLGARLLDDILGFELKVRWGARQQIITRKIYIFVSTVPAPSVSTQRLKYSLTMCSRPDSGVPSGHGSVPFGSISVALTAVKHRDGGPLAEETSSHPVWRYLGSPVLSNIEMGVVWRRNVSLLCDNSLTVGYYSASIESTLYSASTNTRDHRLRLRGI